MLREISDLKMINNAERLAKLVADAAKLDAAAAPAMMQASVRTKTKNQIRSEVVQLRPRISTHTASAQSGFGRA